MREIYYHKQVYSIYQFHALCGWVGIHSGVLIVGILSTLYKSLHPIIQYPPIAILYIKWSTVYAASKK